METSNLQAGTSLVVTSDDCREDTSDLATLCNQSGLNSFNHTPTPQLVLQSTAMTGDTTNNIPVPTSFPCLSPTSSASLLIDAYQSGFLMDGALGFQQQITSATSSSASRMQITEHSSVVPSAAPLFQLPTPTVLINSSDKVVNICCHECTYDMHFIAPAETTTSNFIIFILHSRETRVISDTWNTCEVY